MTSSLKGKALQWFKILTIGSITNLNELWTTLFNQFREKIDKISFLEQLTTIKRAPNELMANFNFRFQKTWERIQVLVRLTPKGEFIYYLRALNSDIVIMIQSMGGAIFLEAYALTIWAENCLIQARKLTPKPLMPLYLELPQVYHSSISHIYEKNYQPTTSTS